jgi:hypothetical protein
MNRVTEKRKYERVTLPASSSAYLTDVSGKKLGMLRVIGQGGLFCECDPNNYKAGQIVSLRVIDPSEGIDRSLNCEVRYTFPNGVGFAFEELDPDSAVEVGVIIGKYYSAEIP